MQAEEIENPVGQVEKGKGCWLLPRPKVEGEEKNDGKAETPEIARVEYFHGWFLGK